MIIDHYHENPRDLTGNARMFGPCSALASAAGRAPAWMLVALFAALSGVGALACGAEPQPSDPLAQPAGGPPVSLVIANSDLAVGENRVSFGLVDRDYMPIRPANVDVRAVYYEPGASEGRIRHRATAEFIPWSPEARRGTYVAHVAFDRAGAATADTPGIWELHATFEHPEGESLTIGAVVSIAADHKAPFVGDPAPPSDTPTAHSVSDLRTITSSPEPDPALYRLSVADAVRAGQPAVITFATPAFCVSATCGPQVAELSELAAKYGGQANFVHVEVYRDPHLIDPQSPVRDLAPAVSDWGLVSEPWTFVVARNGTISARFEQYVPFAVLESELLSALQH